MNRILLRTFVVLLAFTLALPTVSQAQIQSLELGIGSAFESGHITVRVAEKFKELIEERSNGAIQVNVFPGGVMGGEEDVTEAVMVQAIEMQAGGGVPISMFAPEYFFLHTPFVMKDWEHFLRAWDSHLGEQMREKMRQTADTEFLAVIYRGVRQYTSNRPVVTPDDVRGMKLRLPLLPAWVVVWEGIGANPVPVPLHELYTALATGVADASEGDVEQLWSFKLHEVQSHLSMTNHNVEVGYLTINSSLFHSLNEETRNLILETAQEAGEWGTELVFEREQSLIEDMVAQGMELVESDREAFAEAGRAALERLFETEFTVTTWDEVLSL